MDPINVAQIHLNNQNYFRENDTPDTSPLVQWNAHKYVLRGTLLAMVTMRKCAAQPSLTYLLARRQTLETNHKQWQAQKAYQELIQVRSMFYMSWDENSNLNLRCPKNSFMNVRRKVANS